MLATSWQMKTSLCCSHALWQAVQNLAYIESLKVIYAIIIILQALRVQCGLTPRYWLAQTAKGRALLLLLLGLQQGRFDILQA